jgi:hypothetical protein
MEEPVFHAPWEGKMFALNILAGNWTPREFDPSLGDVAGRSNKEMPWQKQP